MKSKISYIWAVLLCFLAACSTDQGWQEVEQKVSTASEPLTMHSEHLSVGEIKLISQQGIELPESAIVLGNYVCVSGPASFDIAPGEPTDLSCFNRWNGSFKHKFEIPAISPYVPNPGSVAVPGAMGDVFLNVANPIAAQVVRLSTVFGWWEYYSAPLRDVPPCNLNLGGECSKTQIELPPLMNGLVAKSNGSLYVTDSFQATIWKIPSNKDNNGQRVPILWFSSPQLEGNINSSFPAGANGLAIGPDNKLYVTNTTMGPQGGGAIYRLPMVSSPVESDLELVASWPPFTIPGVPYPMPMGPDGIKFDVQGNLWVTFSFGNAVSKLTMSNGIVTNEQRFYQDPATAVVPFQQPSELTLDPLQPIAFFGNHALEPATPANWALFKMGVGVLGAPLQKPNLGWSCEEQDCNGIDWGKIDWAHISMLLFEQQSNL